MTDLTTTCPKCPARVEPYDLVLDPGGALAEYRHCKRKWFRAWPLPPGDLDLLWELAEAA